MILAARYVNEDVTIPKNSLSRDLVSENCRLPKLIIGLRHHLRLMISTAYKLSDS